jgi:tetratricopeptide (TPR) repeat protein
MSSPNRIAMLACALMVALASAQAHAQESLAPTSSVDADEARTAVARAKALFAVGDYGAALAEFTRAHELLHDDPRQGAVLNNIAVCYERMFRYDLALAFYERYLREGSASAEDRAEVEAVMKSLRDLLGTVRITGVTRGEIWIDDRKLGDVAIDVLVPAGLHVIEIRARGYESQRRELRVSARAVHEVHIQLEPIDTYRGLPSTYFWVGTGLTAAAVITGTVFGVAALSEHSDGQREADRGLYVDGKAADDLALQADVAFGAALALGVGTTLLFFLTDWGGHPSAEHDSAAIRVAGGVTPSSVGLLLQGSVP